MNKIGTDSACGSTQNPTPAAGLSQHRMLLLIGPGILVAATGVGAGDLATGAFTGARLGLTVVWAVVLGAFLKFVINEGLARWQLATDTSFLEGAAARFGTAVCVFFLIYLVSWSYLVGGALLGACGVTAHAIFPLESVMESMGPPGMGAAAAARWSARQDKVVYGILHSLVATLLVLLGGYRIFERIMSVCIGVMFVTVVVVASATRPDMAQLAAGFVPQIPSADGFRWAVALIGGVGGTLTVLCYGYWIQEQGRRGPQQIRACRVDLGVGYTMTAIFGICMVILGSRLPRLDGGGSKLIVNLADQLESALGRFGTTARWAFLIGAWGAVFSSLLGVWQSVPYLYADYRRICRGEDRSCVRPTSRDYRGYLFALATLPIASLFFSFRQQQLIYSLVGALCVPLLGAGLLALNGSARGIGPKHRNSRLTNLVLVLAILFFVVYGWLEIQKRITG